MGGARPSRSCSGGVAASFVSTARKCSPHELRSLSEITWNSAWWRERRSSSGMESACEIEVATVSGSYGLTRSAAVHSAAAPAKRDKIRTPGYSESWEAIYFLANRYNQWSHGLKS